jgi:hypothetical protein
MSEEKPNYAQINRKVWNTSCFRSLSKEARDLFFYLTTCPHGNMLGIFVLRPGYALDDLQLGIDIHHTNGNEAAHHDPNFKDVILRNGVRDIGWHNDLTNKKNQTVKNNQFYKENWKINLKVELERLKA